MSLEGQYEDETDAAESSREELLTQLELLAEENQRLRASYTQAKQTQYQRTAAGLNLIGLVAIIGGFVVQSASTVLFILGGIGLFGGVLTYYITPEQFVSADVGRDIYTTLAGNEAAIVSELGLSDTRLYVPASNDTVRLFIPQHKSDSLPEVAMLEQTVVVPSDETPRGLAFDPSGERLFDAFEDALTGSLATAPKSLAEQLSDAVVEQFELAETVTTELDDDNQQVIIAVNGSVYGPLDRFDHPIPSVFATGLAQGLDAPVSVGISEATGDRAEYIVTCRWDKDDQSITSG
jgi:hypothetical protein